MRLFSAVRSKAAGAVDGAQQSMRRARLEGERRLLQRRHRTALEALGARAHALVATGGLPADPLTPELADVDARLMEIDALTQEIEALRSPDEEAGDDA